MNPMHEDLRDARWRWALLVLGVVALLVGLLAACGMDIADAACRPDGQSCTVNADCCSGNCRNGCRPAVGTTTTTLRTTTTLPSSTTTTSTRPPGSTTTTTRPAGLRELVLGDFGLHWTGQSQELMYDHRTGAAIDQATGWFFTLYLRGVVEPEAIAAASELPSCARVVPTMLAATDVTTSKFLFDYVLRPVVSGGTYAVHGNYLWDLTHNEYLEPLRSCVLADARANAAWLDARPDWQQALDLSVRDGAVVRGDPTYRVPPPCAGTGRNDDDHRYTYSCARAGLPKHPRANDGAVSARFPDVPLGVAQCDALRAFKAAHDASVGVPAARAAFFATARTPRERMLFAIPFTSHVDPHRDRLGGVGRDLLAKKHAGFATWFGAFHCPPTPGTAATAPPVLVEVLAGLFPHLTAHNLLAEPPGAKLRSICPATLQRTGRKAVVTCPFVEG